MADPVQSATDDAIPSTVSAPDPQPASGQGADSWEAAATPPGSSGAAAASAKPEMPTTDASSSATVAPEAAPAPVAPQPVVVTSLKPAGIKGVMQTVMDAMVGKSRPEIGVGSDGNQYVKQTSLTHGEQWVRLIGEGLTGAAEGLKAGKGAGNFGAAAAAGVEAGAKQADARQQQTTDMTEQAQKQNLANANNQMLRMQMAEQSMRATRLQTEATQHDIEFAQGQEDRYVKEGGTVLGVMAHPGDLHKILAVNPDVMQDMIQKHQIEMVPHVDPDGKRDGFSVIKMPNGYRQTMLPAGAVFHTFDQTTGQYTEHKSAQPITQGEIDDYEHAAGVAGLKFQSDKTEAELKAQQAAEAKANASKVPSEITKNNAEAEKARAEAAKAKALDPNDPQIAVLGEAAARGALTEDQISSFGKNKAAVEAYLAQHHPNLDQKSIVMDAGQRKQVNLATNATHNLDSIGAILQRRPDLLGVINGRVSQGKELAGTNDPDLSAINTELDNYALAATGAHGIRAVQARADAKKALLNGFKNGPQGVAASLAASKMSLQNLASAGKPRGLDGNPYVYNTNQPAATGGAKPPAAAATPTGVPPGAQPGYQNGKLVGYQDAQGWHPLGGQ